MIKDKKSSSVRAADLYQMYRVVRDLSTPFDEMYPFKLGLIDKDGKKLKKAESKDEKNAMDLYNKFIINTKRLFHKFGLKSKISTLAGAMLLFREDYKKMKEEDKIKYVYENMDMLSKHKSFKDIIEDVPANATGTAVAGTGDDSSVVPIKKHNYKVGPYGDRKKKGRYINGVAFLKKIAREAQRRENESRETKKTT